MGAKPKYTEWLTPDGLLRIEGWARDGLSLAQIAHNVGVADSTFRRWKEENEALSAAIKRGNAPVDLEVENAMLKSALGHKETVRKAIKVKTEKQKVGEGKIVEEHIEYVDEEVYIPPQVIAQIFWLKNRRPDKWKEKQVVEADTTALEKLDTFIKAQPKFYENDEINEYHSFPNPLEELIFNEYIGCEKELRFIPDNQPVEDLFYTYGFLLRDAARLDEAEDALKEALRINPVSTRIILELCDIYRMKAPTFNKFYFYTMDALRYAYSGYELARIYRNLGFYYYEENNIELSIACYRYSLKYENEPFTQERIKQLEKSYNISLTEEKCKELMKSKHIKLEVDPFIIENLEKLAIEYENDNMLNQSLFFYRLLYSINKENSIFEKIKKLDLMLRKQKKNLII